MGSILTAYGGGDGHNVTQYNARPAHTHHGSIWGCSNYVRRAPCRRRTDGRDRSHETPLALHICCLYRSPSTSAMILRQAMCPSGLRDFSLSRINVRTKTARKSGSCGNRAAPLLSFSATADLGRHRLITGGHGERHLPVVVFVKRSSPRRLPRPPWKRRYQVSTII